MKVRQQHTDQYHSVTQDAVGNNLSATQALITFDTPFDYVRCTVNQPESQNNTHAGSGTTMGAQLVTM